MKVQAVEKELLDPGWRKVYQPPEDEHDTVPAGKGTLAALEIGQRVRPKKVRTRRQSGLNEARLIRAMRENGIGRPATYALIVESLLARKYVEREKSGQLQLTQRGQQVYEFLIGKFPALFELAYTVRMESALDDVAGGRLSYESAVEGVWSNLKRWLKIKPSGRSKHGKSADVRGQ